MEAFHLVCTSVQAQIDGFKYVSTSRAFKIDMLGLSLIVWFLLYLIFLAGCLITLLFGEHERFDNTILSKAHSFLTDGICIYMERFIRFSCGRKGLKCASQLESICCERSNPIGQLIFITLLGGAYYLFYSTVFPLHTNNTTTATPLSLYFGTSLVLLVLIFFSLTCFVDPGIITKDNIHNHLALYPPTRGGFSLFPLRDCPTCNLPKPARSKHCRGKINACVARYDHYCVWINGPVALGNMRWFMAFLFSTSFLALYGVILGVTGIKGDMNSNGSWDYAYMSSKENRLVILHESWRDLGYFVVTRYQPQVAASLFAGAAGLIVLFFSVFQMHRLCTGYTTNEVFRMREMKREMRQQYHTNNSGDPSDPSYLESSVTWDTRWKQSLSEVIWPGYYLQRAPGDYVKRA